MANVENTRSVVIDIGGASVKAGFAGEDEPCAVFPTIIGRPPFDGPLSRKTCVGDDALFNRSSLRLHSPFNRGVFTSWDDMEEIYRHTFDKELCVASNEHPVLLTTGPLTPIHQREKTTQMMFETFNLPAMYVAISGVLSMYSSGFGTGVAVDVGEDMSYSMPIFEGTALSYATLWLDIGGRNLTEYLMEDMLNSRGYNLWSSQEMRDWVRDMKEKLGYVALDHDKELEIAESGSSDIEKNYKLPDGQVITIGVERFKCPEVLFQPYLIDNEMDGIHEITNDSIKRCNSDIRKALYRNIVLSGESTLFPGFANRMRKEITSLVAPRSLKINFNNGFLDSNYRVWKGGSIFAWLDIFRKMWISKAEYDESGPSIVNRKCF